MKHLFSILALAVLPLCSLPAAERGIADFPTITGAQIDTAADSLLLIDGSAENPQGRKMTFAQLANVSGLFASTSHTHSLSNLTQSGATTGQVPTWNGSAWAPATVSSNLTSGPVTSSAGVSTIADGALSIAKTSGLQTALDAKALINTGPLRVACVGTSITNQGSTLVTDTNPRIHDLTNGHAGWLEHLSNHRIRLMRRNGVFEGATDKTFGYGGFKFPGLTDGTSGVYPLDNALASGAEVIIAEGGANDILTEGVDAATAVTRATAYWTKAVNSGKRIIAFNITPCGSSSGATKRDAITTANASLVSIAAGLGVTLIDTHSVATKDGSGYATDETLWDGVHPTPAYAHRLAKLVNTQIAALYANRPQEMIVPAAASGVWITANNSPTGTSIPSGWAKSGTFTDTYSTTTDGDGTTWQRIRMVQGGSANSYNDLYIRATSGFSAGDRVRFAVRIRGVSGSFSCREVEFTGRTTANYSAWQYFVGISGGTNLGTGSFDPITGLFVSPIFTIPTGTVAVDAKLGFYNTDVTVDVRQFGVFKVVENQ